MVLTDRQRNQRLRNEKRETHYFVISHLRNNICGNANSRGETRPCTRGRERPEHACGMSLVLANAMTPPAIRPVLAMIVA